MKEEMLKELILLGAEAPVRILTEKGEGKDDMRTEISGNTFGIFVAATTLFENITKFIRSKDDNLFKIWASTVVKTLGNAIDDGEGDDDED